MSWSFALLKERKHYQTNGATGIISLDCMLFANILLTFSRLLPNDLLPLHYKVMVFLHYYTGLIVFHTY